MGRNRRRKAHNKENKERRVEDNNNKKKVDDVKIIDLNSKLKDDEDEGTPLLSKSVGTQVSVVENCTSNGTQTSQENTKLKTTQSPEPHLIGLNPKTKPTLRHRDYYLHYLCHVCKTIPKSSQKVSCAKCKLVTYCSMEHKREHWPSHADVCQALGELFQQTNFKNVTPDDFRKIRVNMLEQCEKAIERPLEKSEKEIILYYNRCFECYERDDNLLKSCNICKHISFCKDHAIQKNHDKYCSSLVVYRDIVLHIIGDDLVSIYFPDTFSKQFEEVDMKTLCSKETDSDLESAFLSELATSPLSVLRSLKLVFGSFKNVPGKLCIHVIGAENDFELSAIEKWEIFLAHYLSCSEIILVFIGPELFQEGSTHFTSCEECEVWNKRIIMKFHGNVLYHDYVQGPDFVKPDLICSFNPGIYRSTGFNQTDTWEETIIQILRQDVPVLITAYTEIEILKDVERIEKTAKLHFLQTPSLNEFSSLKPFLSFVNDEVSPIIFKNHFYTVFKKC
ncbi:uncharacterized protein LOC103517882 [Diaphorina citri]|uniref:Uncharacterized protein LOC103517194 n=1 Tax=Diaphorina citri TaxID=121845 RepID=A0A1S3DEN9_DIACI|nr:uncharacterized protein LOC103517194 [Diaphorina citri]XP_008481155.1 uncharacterized protein LOC103517882 [Diaphorina citri]